MAAIGFVALTLEVSREGRSFVSRRLELGTASRGDTFEEALANVKDATLMYLSTIERLGERPRIFQEKGIVVRRTRPSRLKRAYEVHPDAFVGPYVAKIPLSA